LGGEVVPRSLLYNTLGNEHYLLGGLGDGHLVIWRFDPASRQLSQRKRVPLATQPGTTRTLLLLLLLSLALPLRALRRSVRCLLVFYPFPVILHPFRSGNTTHVFACCDRPTVIYAVPTTGKLVYSNVNLREVAHMCSFSTEAFTGTLHPSACRSPSPSPSPSPVYARPHVGQLAR
jgi:DNA damage-binding protein 1